MDKIIQKVVCATIALVLTGCSSSTDTNGTSLVVNDSAGDSSENLSSGGWIIENLKNLIMI